MKEIIAGRIPLDAGLVQDTKYTRCFWPRLDKPTTLFDPKSSGIVVEGPPTPRNVIFPKDTVFINTRSDCHFIRDDAYISLLTPQEADDISSGKLDVTAKSFLAVFTPIEQSLDDPNLRIYQKTGSVMVDVTATFDALAEDI